MRTFNIIALCGYKRCGKDFASEHIVKKYNYIHYKLATKLKKIVKELFNFNDEQIEGDKKENVDSMWGISPRQAMQYIGTDVFQHHMNKLIPGIDNTFWVRTLVNDIRKNKPENVVISDMRFIHEYDYIKKHLNRYNLTVIKITNDGRTKDDSHISENSFNQIPFDYVITNAYDSQFVTNIDSVVKEIDVDNVSQS